MARWTRAAVVSLAVLAVFAGGCSDDGDDTARTVETTTTTVDDSTESTPTGDDTGSDGGQDLDGGGDELDTPLAEVVVRLEDLPTGWIASPPEADDEADDSFCEGHDPMDAVDPVDEAESNFQQGELGPFVAALAGRYDDEGTAGAVLEELDTAVDACQSFTEVQDDGTEVSYTFSALSFPNLGDDTYAARLGASTPFGPLAMDFAFARVGDHVVAVINGGLGEADSELTEELLRLMVDRL